MRLSADGIVVRVFVAGKFYIDVHQRTCNGNELREYDEREVAELTDRRTEKVIEDESDGDDNKSHAKYVAVRLNCCFFHVERTWG